MRSYMETYPGREFDDNLWQAHFRKHATFITRCNHCIDLVEQALARKHRRHPGPQRGARAGDISSDEESSDEQRASRATSDEGGERGPACQRKTCIVAKT